jgi:predicted acetyltransferase
VRVQDEGALARIKALYHAWAKGYQFTLARDEAFRADWRNIFSNPGSGRDYFVYLLPDAYCVTEVAHDQATDRSVLKVRDYAFSSPKGRHDLLAFWGGFYGQVDLVEALVPTDDPLLPDISDSYQASTSPMQARVASVEHAFGALKAREAAGFTTAFALRVQDDFCPWNDATFKIELSSDGVTVDATHGAADLTLDVRTLALLLSGGLSVTAAQRAGMLGGALEHAHALAALADGRTSFMSRVDAF